MASQAQQIISLRITWVTAESKYFFLRQSWNRKDQLYLSRTNHIINYCRASVVTVVSLTVTYRLGSAGRIKIKTMSREHDVPTAANLLH